MRPSMQRRWVSQDIPEAGHDCFKVTVTKKENLLEGFSFLGFEATPEFEDKYRSLLYPVVEIRYYVTEDIDIGFHPIDHVEAIVIRKYFPLEGEREMGFLQGMGTSFSVEKLESRED